MAGWSKRVDGSGLESFRTPEQVPKLGRCFDSEPGLKRFVKIDEDNDKAKLLFVEILTRFLQEVTGPLCFRPLPPMLGDGKSVDLFKLYLVVREKGGYQRVSTSESWGVVAKECGLDSSSGLALKLVYVKYLDTLDRWMLRLKQPDRVESEVGKCDSGFGGVSMDLELDLEDILKKISGEKKKDEGYENVERRKSELDSAADGKLGNGVEAQDSVGSIKDSEKFDNACTVNEKSSAVYDEEHLKFANGSGDVQQPSTNDVGLTTFSVVKDDDVISRKRKRKSYMDMLNWVTEVAKNPCDSAIESLPERSKWNSYGNEVVWKQVLLLRDEMFLKRDVDTSAQYSIWQKKQKMHPSMYDDGTGSERVRCSQRVLSAKVPLKKTQFLSASSSSPHSDEDLVDGSTDSPSELAIWGNHRRKKIPVGPQFQAEIPELNDGVYEYDSKWLGTRFWPLEKHEKKRMLIERDPAGKGRQDTCGCQYPGSYDCVRFHLVEKRRKVKIELGSAFYHWKLDSMGEEVALSWTKADEQKFHDIAKSEPLSEGQSFWNAIFKSFPHKSRELLVSYYFNVFILRQRGQQNRTNTDIDSDDDNSEIGPRANYFGRDPKSSILCSPRKTDQNPR